MWRQIWLWCLTSFFLWDFATLIGVIVNSEPIEREAFFVISSGALGYIAIREWLQELWRMAREVKLHARRVDVFVAREDGEDDC